MSATTTIKNTRNGLATLKYCNRQSKAHNGWNMPRVLTLSAGLGLTPDQAEKRMQEIWKQKGTQQKHQIEAYTIVQSFDPTQFSYKSAKDIKKVNELGKKFASRAFAGRVFTVATQADGKKHVLHNHIVVCSQDPVTLKSLRGVRTSVKYTREINDEILRENGYTPIKTQNLVKADSIAMRKMREKHPDKPLKVDVIRDRLDKLMARKDITSFATLIKEAKEEKLDIRTKFNNHGGLSRISYRLLDNDENLRMTKGIRPKRLGEIYEKRNLQQFLQANAEYSRNQERNKQDVRSTVQGISATFGENLERGTFESPTVKNGGNRSQNSERDQSTVEDPSSTGGSQTGFSRVTVYYPRGTSKRLKKPRNTFKRPRREAGQPSQPTATDFPSFEQSTRNAKQFATEFDELKRDFKRLNSTPNKTKLWWNAVFDDGTLKDLKQLFKEYDELKTAKRFRGRTHESPRANRRSTYDATNEPNELDF